MILLKLIPLLRPLAKVFEDASARVKLAKAAESDGGTKVTATEVLAIVLDEIGPVALILAKLIAPAAFA